MHSKTPQKPLKCRHFLAQMLCHLFSIKLKSDLLGEYKNALIHLIMTYSNRYWNDKKLLEYPTEWAEGADEIMDLKK